MYEIKCLERNYSPLFHCPLSNMAKKQTIEKKDEKTEQKGVCMKKKKCKPSFYKKNELKNRVKFYQVMYNLPKKTRCSIIPYLADEYVNFLSEAVYNTVNTNLGLTKKQKNRLRKELNCCKNSVKSICSEKTSIGRRRHILTQKGGFLGILLSTILPIISSLIVGAVTPNKP